MRELVTYRSRLRKLRRIFAYHKRLTGQIFFEGTPQLGVGKKQSYHQRKRLYEACERLYSLCDMHYELCGDLVEGCTKPMGRCSGDRDSVPRFEVPIRIVLRKETVRP